MSNYNGKTFNEILKEKRLAKGWQPKQLADKLNTNRESVYDWEKGYCEPRLFMVIAIADLFECSLDELVGRQ